MQQDKVKVELSGTSVSMLMCLWGRAQVSREYSSLFYDEKAIELVERIDYDFSSNDVPFEDIMSNISRNITQPEFGLFTLRAKQFDEKAKAYIAEHPHASIINIAAGLDTTFYRVDNGTIHWYDLDLPSVIDIRKQLLPEPDRVMYIAKSLIDPSWCNDVKHTEHGVFIIAGGVNRVLHSFEEVQVKQFFSMLADNFPDGEIVFDAISRSDGSFRTWMDRVPPEQRDAMRAAWMEAMKSWWEKAPQNQKDKLYHMIATLQTPTKPKGKAWSDLEVWWDQLSDTEKTEALHDLMRTFRGKAGTWVPKDINEIAKWDSRITVIDQFPMFKNISRNLVSEETRRFMDYNDQRGESSIIHLRV